MHHLIISVDGLYYLPRFFYIHLFRPFQYHMSISFNNANYLIAYIHLDMEACLVLWIHSILNFIENMFVSKKSTKKPSRHQQKGMRHVWL